MKGSPEQIQGAVLGLLIITSAKFYTSLMALGSSIILSMIFRWFESWRDRLFSKLTDKLELGLDFISVEKITLKQLECVSSQTETLKTFSTDLAIALGKHMEEAVSKAMSPVVEELTAMGKNMGQDNVNAIKEIGEAVVQNVQGAAGESLGHLSENLGELVKVLGGMPASLKKSTEKFEAGVESALKKLTKAADENANKMGSAIEAIPRALEESASAMAEGLSEAGKAIKEAFGESVSDLAGSMTTFGDRLDAAEKSVENLSSTLAKVSDDMGNASSGIHESVKSLQEGVEVMDDLLKPALSAVGDIQTAVEHMNEGVAESAAKLNGALQRLEDQMRANVEMWEEHSKQFDGVNERLGEIFLGVSRQIEDSQKRMQTFVGEMDKSFSAGISYLQEVVNELKDAVGDLTEEHKAKRMQKLVVGMDKSFSTGIAGLLSAVDDLKDTVGDLAEERKAAGEENES